MKTFSDLFITRGFVETFSESSKFVQDFLGLTKTVLKLFQTNLSLFKTRVDTNISLKKYWTCLENPWSFANAVWNPLTSFHESWITSKKPQKFRPNIE